jgi:hypothetical protein
MMNHDADNVASFGGGGQIPTVDNNNMVVEKTSKDFAGGKPSDSTERVFALDYAIMRQNYTIRLWFTGIYFIFLASMITSLLKYNLSWNWTGLSLLVCLGGLWWLLYHSLSRARCTVHQQNVALTATGIHYDKHNVPDGSTFHTTYHVRFICFVSFCFFGVLVYFWFLL